MKKGILCLTLVFAILFFLPAAHGEESRKLTLMIYMCGSNLESSAGSATEDIREMLDSMPAGRDVTVLVMTGGSDLPAGTGYFQQENAGIYELASGGRIRRIVQAVEPQNMGDGATLAEFLRYGQENRPAQRYALILWDHGGGPLEGVCWDETADMDHLTMAEVTGALEEALTQKLDWIGFDACLMCSLEVAGELSPFADYMIASQEMEPSFGWNYSFLTDLPGDANGAESGRRIVDAFFEGQEDSGEILTLACIDLNAAGDAIAALDPVFFPMSENMNEESYLALSARRMTTVGFGKAEPGFTGIGYDLVDARDLSAGLEQTEATEMLIAKLDAAVVYSRANEEGANGLTLYYPYANKTNYLEKWKNGYAELSFSPGYQAYVESFGRLLTGEVLFRWLNLIPDTPVAKEDGTFTFSMPLTTEQTENTVSVQLLIIRDVFSSRLSDGCVVVASCDADIGADGIVRATWDGRCLYAEKEDGTLTGPVSFRQSDDGKSRAVIAYYNNNDQLALDGHPVFMILDAEDTSEYPEIIRTQVWDEATQSFTSRLRFSEEEYVRVFFWNLDSIYPGAGEDNILPDVWGWEQAKGVNAPGFALPQNWRLRYVREDSGEQYYAVFRLLDTQQQAVCSVPAEVPNPYRTVALPVSGRLETPEVRLDLACTVDTSPDGFGLHLEWTVENRTDEKMQVRIADPILNGTRITEDERTSPGPGETTHPDTLLNLYDTAFLDTLESVSGTLEFTAGDGETQEIPFSFTFESADLSALRTDKEIAQTAKDGVTLHLLGAEPDQRCGLVLYILAENNSGGDFRMSDATLNGINFSNVRDPIPDGMSRALEVYADNNNASISMRINGDKYQVTYLEDWLLQSLGFQEIRILHIWADAGTETGKCFTLIPDDPILLEEPAALHKMGQFYPIWNPPESLDFPQEDKIPVIARNNNLRLRLRRVVVGDSKICLSVEAANLSNRWIEPDTVSAFVNGAEITFTDAFVGGIPPYMTEYGDLTLELPDGETQLRQIELTIRDYSEAYPQNEATAVVTANEPVPAGQEGGTWVNGDSFTAETAILPDYVPQEKAEGILLPDLLVKDLKIPENAADCHITLDIGIQPEEAADIQFCKVCVVRKEETGSLEVITIQDVSLDGDGRIIMEHPGLFPAVAGHPEYCVTTYLIDMDESQIHAAFNTYVTVYSEKLGMAALKDIRWTLNSESNTAEITSFKYDDSYGEPDLQMEICSVQFTPFVVQPEPLADGTLPHIADMEQDFMRIINAPGFDLEGRPLQFMLRPITREDDLYILVSVLKTDGTRYSLPLIPFPSAEN